MSPRKKIFKMAAVAMETDKNWNFFENLNFIFLVYCWADLYETLYTYCLHWALLNYAIKLESVGQIWPPLPWKQKKGGVFQKFLFSVINSFKVCIIRLYLYLKGFWSHFVTKWLPLSWQRSKKKGGRKKFLDFDLKLLETFFR